MLSKINNRHAAIVLLLISIVGLVKAYELFRTKSYRIGIDDLETFQPFVVYWGSYLFGSVFLIICSYFVYNMKDDPY